jgi:hypothetical protein
MATIIAQQLSAGYAPLPDPPQRRAGRARAARGLAPRPIQPRFVTVARVNGVSPARGASWRATGSTALDAPAVAGADRRSSDAACARDAPVPRPRD